MIAITARRLAAALAAITLIILPTACGSDDGDGGGDGGGTVMVTITEKSGDITASSDLVKATTGQKIMFMVTTDAPDEIHVHSVPDHEFEIQPGHEQTFTFSVRTPGTIEVESHELDTTILKLEVS
jgi:hypothetical protein